MSPSYRLPHVCILGPISLYAKDIYCSRTKSIFKNYSAKLELIGTIFYRETSIQVARFCGNFWRRPPNGREIVTKFARTVRTFCHQKNASFHPPLNSRFPWNLNTKPESVSSWILSEQNYEIFSDKRSLTRQNLNFSVFGTLLHDARDPALASRSLQRIWALHLIVEGPRCFLIRRCFRTIYRFRDVGVQTHPLLPRKARNFAYRITWIAISRQLATREKRTIGLPLSVVRQFLVRLLSWTTETASSERWTALLQPTAFSETSTLRPLPASLLPRSSTPAL